MSEILTTTEVILSRIIDANGRMSIKVQLPENYNAVEILGLMEMAKLYVYSGLKQNFTESE